MPLALAGSASLSQHHQQLRSPSDHHRRYYTEGLLLLEELHLTVQCYHMSWLSINMKQTSSPPSGWPGVSPSSPEQDGESVG